MTRRRESPLDILLRLGAAGPDCSEDDVVRMYRGHLTKRKKSYAKRLSPPWEASGWSKP